MKTKHTPVATFIRNVIATLIRYDRWKHRNPLMYAQMKTYNPMRSAAFWMLALVIVIASCAPKRTITSNTTTNTEKTEKVDSTFRNRETKTEERKVDTETQRTLLDIENLTEEWEIRHRTFDTTLPTDSISGLPPLASETIIVRKRTGSKQATVNENVKEKTDSKLSEEVKRTGEYKKAVKEVDKVVERTKERTKPQPTWWIVIALLATLAMIVLVAYIVNSMNKKPY